MFFKDNKIYINAGLYYVAWRRKNRLIFSPCKELKKLQRYFLNAIKWEYKLHLNVQEAAKVHAGKKWILKMDIKDFYNSVPPDKIMKFLKKVCEHIDNANIRYYYGLVTLYDKLPTGAPTSPYIANACFEYLEKKIKNLCCIHDVTFSKYMDDLTFSCDSKEQLNIIEKRVKSLLFLNGYIINDSKTKYISDNKRQEILGVVVNDGYTRLSKKMKRNIRAMIYNYKRQKNINNDNLKYSVNEQQLNGYLAYVKSVDEEFYKKLHQNIYFDK